MRPVSFHSTQAASHALQPMHVVVSMYFETVGIGRNVERLPRTEAEERRISRDCNTAIVVALLSGLLELQEEGLVLGSPRVRVHGRRSQGVRERAAVSLGAGEAPVNREADVPHRLAAD